MSFSPLVFLLLLPFCFCSHSFLSIGDWGCGIHNPKGNDSVQVAVAASMASIATQFNVSFILGLGDNFYEYGVTSLEDVKFHDTFENIYSAKSLQIPWYHILGNHDHRGNITAQILYSNVSARWIMPNRYYAKSMLFGSQSKIITFVFIDTNSFQSNPQSDNEQLVWINSTLASVSDFSNFLFVVGHHPMFSGGEHGSNKNLQQVLKSLLENYGAIYLGGHDHNLQHLKSGNVEYFLSGNGCKSNGVYNSIEQSLWGSLENGFILHTLDEECTNMKFDFYNTKQEVIYSYTIKARF